MTPAVRVPPSACSTVQSSMIWRSPSFFRSMAARRPRPIRRLISCCRPPLIPRFHGMRVGLDGGIIAYSLVTQPWPRPCRNEGTCSSTAALHNTHVSPIRMRHEAGVEVRNRGSILTGRSCSAARPSARVPISLPIVSNHERLVSRNPVMVLAGPKIVPRRSERSDAGADDRLRGCGAVFCVRGRRLCV